MKDALRTALRLGRVSNLPTVWTNVLAGMALNSARPTLALVLPVGTAMSLAYVAGMYLNDAFDRRWDAVHRPERPIPAGDIAPSTVFAAGFAMLGAALGILLAGPGGLRPFLAGLALALLIVLYDSSHKKNPIAPLVMGLCRVAVYFTAALAAAPEVRPAVYVGASVLLVYLVALSVIARFETRNPRLSRLVGPLIAGISLVDGAQLAVLGRPRLFAVCLVAFFVTRRLQRRIAGT
jgi:4-hydroxybenzoate polyprenyltransferase